MRTWDPLAFSPDEAVPDEMRAPNALSDGAAWDELRKDSPADLRAFIMLLEYDLGKLRQTITFEEEGLEEIPDSAPPHQKDAIEAGLGNLRILEDNASARLTACYHLLRFRLSTGKRGELPMWDDLTTEEREAATIPKAAAVLDAEHHAKTLLLLRDVLHQPGAEGYSQDWAFIQVAERLGYESPKSHHEGPKIAEALRQHLKRTTGDMDAWPTRGRRKWTQEVVNDWLAFLDGILGDKNDAPPAQNEAPVDQHPNR